MGSGSGVEGWLILDFGACMKRILSLLLLAVFSVWGTACTGWPRGWAKAKGISYADGVSGAWEGTWHSIPTGHRGKLRCAVTPKSEGVWEYRYRASWWKVFCAGFKVDCEVRKLPDGSWEVVGERDLGKLFGGIFSHRGIVSGDEMKAEYRSKADHGELRLRRVEPEGD